MVWQEGSRLSGKDFVGRTREVEVNSGYIELFVLTLVLLAQGALEPMIEGFSRSAA